MSSAHKDVPEAPYRRLYVEAVALRKAARWNDAAQRFDAVLASLGASPEDDPDISLAASYLRIDCLHQQGDGERTVAACDALLATYGPAPTPRRWT